MRILRLLALELRCLMQNRLSLFLLLLSILSPLIGLFLIKPSSARTMQSMYLANPAICGGAGRGRDYSGRDRGRYRGREC